MSFFKSRVAKLSMGVLVIGLLLISGCLSARPETAGNEAPLGPEVAPQSEVAAPAVADQRPNQIADRQSLADYQLHAAAPKLGSVEASEAAAVDQLMDRQALADYQLGVNEGDLAVPSYVRFDQISNRQALAEYQLRVSGGLPGR